jgi:UPF0716 protein FxsA
VLGRLFLLFTLVLVVEIYLLVMIGGLVGVGPTLALIAGSGVLGAWLALREGRKAIVVYQGSLTKGELPEDGMVSGLLILAGGFMLITPGVITDVFGLALMVPPIRRGAASLIKRRMLERLEAGQLQVMQISVGGLGFGADVRDREQGSFIDAEIVDVEARVNDDHDHHDDHHDDHDASLVRDTNERS